jgi:hypothetical protein
VAHTSGIGGATKTLTTYACDERWLFGVSLTAVAYADLYGCLSKHGHFASRCDCRIALSLSW